MQGALSFTRCFTVFSLQHMRYIRSHYNIEDFIYYDYHIPSEHAHLHHFMLNPVFASYAKHFIKVHSSISSMMWAQIGREPCV